MSRNNLFYTVNFIMFFLVCMGGCASGKPHHIEADRIIANYSKQAKEEGFYLFGSGGYFLDQINKFSLSYINLTCPVNIDRARWLLVTQSENFFSLVNNDTKVRPYLAYFPYDEKSIDFGLIFRYPEEFKLSEKPITYVRLMDGIVSYGVDDGHLNKETYSEPYSEAYQKVYGKPLPARGEDLKCN